MNSLKEMGFLDRLNLKGRSGIKDHHTTNKYDNYLLKKLKIGPLSQ